MSTITGGSSTPTPTPTTTTTPASSSSCSPNGGGGGQGGLAAGAGFPLQQQQQVQYQSQQYGQLQQQQQLGGQNATSEQQQQHLHSLAALDDNNNSNGANHNTDSLVSTDLSHLAPANNTAGQTVTPTAAPTTTTTITSQNEQQSTLSEADDELQFINHIDDQRSRFGLNRGDACEILALTLAEAHIGTCLVSSERIAELIMSKRRELGQFQCQSQQEELDGQRAAGRENKRFNYLSSLTYEELWLECANRLTNIIQQIIEFAKMVPSFMLMEQDDQIVLLKAGSFELCCLRISRYYDLETNQLLFGNGLIPMDLFVRASGE